MDDIDERRTSTAAGAAATTAAVTAPPAAGLGIQPEAPPGPPGALARLAWVWWVYLVLAVRRLSAGLATTLADGLYLVVWPLAAFLLPPLALLLGLALGATHPGYGTSFTESLPLLMLIVVLGTLSGHLGLAFLVGYAAGDFFVFNFDRLTDLVDAAQKVPGAADPPAAAWDLAVDLGRLWLPLLIQYSLMALPLTTFPVLTKTLLRALSFLARLGPWARFVATAVHAALTFALVYFWTQSVPLLIRPLFTWREESIPAAAVSPLQTDGLILAVAGAVASLVRMSVQGLTTYEPRLRAAIDPAMERLGAGAPVTPTTGRLPRIFGVLGRGLAVTLLLGGLYVSWVDWFALFLLVLLIEAARVRLLPIPLGPWPGILQRVPAILRIAGTIAVTALLANALAARVQDAQTFRPLVILTGVALLVSYIFNPVSPSAPREEQEVAA